MEIVCVGFSLVGLGLSFPWFGVGFSLVWFGLESFPLICPNFKCVTLALLGVWRLIAGKLFKQHRGAFIGFPISAALCIAAVMNTELRVSDCYSLYWNEIRDGAIRRRLGSC